MKRLHINLVFSAPRLRSMASQQHIARR